NRELQVLFTDDPFDYGIDPAVFQGVMLLKSVDSLEPILQWAAPRVPAVPGASTVTVLDFLENYATSEELQRLATQILHLRPSQLRRPDVLSALRARFQAGAFHELDANTLDPVV